MMEKKESFDEKCRRLGLFDKSLEDIIDMIAEKNREIARLAKALMAVNPYDEALKEARFSRPCK